MDDVLVWSKDMDQYTGDGSSMCGNGGGDAIVPVTLKVSLATCCGGEGCMSRAAWWKPKWAYRLRISAIFVRLGVGVSSKY